MTNDRILLFSGCYGRMEKRHLIGRVSRGEGIPAKCSRGDACFT